MREKIALARILSFTRLSDEQITALIDKVTDIALGGKVEYYL